MEKMAVDSLKRDPIINVIHNGIRRGIEVALENGCFVDAAGGELFHPRPEMALQLMEADEIGDSIAGIRDEVLLVVIDEYIPPQSMEEQWDIAGLTQALEREFR